MRPNTYCAQCQRPTGMRACIHCKLKSTMFLAQEFEFITTQPDMLELQCEMKVWYLDESEPNK